MASLIRPPADLGTGAPIGVPVTGSAGTPIRPPTPEDLSFLVTTPKPTRRQTMNRHRAIRGTPRVNAKVTEELKRQKAAAEAHAATARKFEAAGIDIAPLSLFGKGDDKVCRSCYQSKDTTDEVHSCFICHCLICRDCSRIYFPPDVVRAKKNEHDRLLRHESRMKKRPAGDCAPPEKKGRVSEDDKDDDVSAKEGSGSSSSASDDEDEDGTSGYLDGDLPGICKSCACPPEAKEEPVSLLECAGVVLALARAHATEAGEAPNVAAYLKHLWDTKKIDGEAEIDGLMMPTVEQP